LERSQASPVFPLVKAANEMNKNMGHWWKDTDEGKLTYFEKNLSQY
jgi:hypothetical protein